MIVQLKNESDLPRFMSREIYVANQVFKIDPSIMGFNVDDFAPYAKAVRDTMNPQFWQIKETLNKKVRAKIKKEEVKKEQDELDKLPSKKFNPVTGKYDNVPPKNAQDPIVEALGKAEDFDSYSADTEDSKDKYVDGKKEVLTIIEDVEDAVGQDLIAAEQERELALEKAEEEVEEVPAPETPVPAPETPVPVPVPVPVPLKLKRKPRTGKKSR